MMDWFVMCERDSQIRPTWASTNIFYARDVVATIAAGELSGQDDECSLAFHDSNT